jgi:hypothetical protein
LLITLSGIKQSKEMKQQPFSEVKIRLMLDPRDHRPLYLANDVVQALTGMRYPGDYIRRLQKTSDGFRKYYKRAVIPMPVRTSKGIRTMDGLKALNVLEMIQFIPDPCMMPFRTWMAGLAMENLKYLKYSKDIISNIAEFTHPAAVSRIDPEEQLRRQRFFLNQFIQTMHMSAQEHLDAAKETNDLHKTDFFQMNAAFLARERRFRFEI